MQKTVESAPIRTYCVLITNQPIIRIRADIMCKGSPVQFKREGQVVGVIETEIIAWWIGEERPEFNAEIPAA